MGFISVALLAVALFLGWTRVRARRQREEFERGLTVLQHLVSERRHQEALDLIAGNVELRRKYKLSPEENVAVADLETEALLGTGRLHEAVVCQATLLSVRWPPGEWPAERLERWLELYRRASPLRVEPFFFCECCGLHPDTEALLRHAIEHGCAPPAGFDEPAEGEPRPVSGVVLHLSSPRRFGE